MQKHALDEGVFIRSLATRGQQGGLSRSTAAAVAVLDAAGFPVIFVETVGAGQAELDVADATDAVVVVTAPGLGDDVQALKVGLLEIADILVVNKGDREGADRAVADLTAMLALGARPAPPILKTVATSEAGIQELVAALEGRRQAPETERAARRRRQAARQVAAVAADTLRARVHAALGRAGGGDPVARTIASVAERTLDPWSAAEFLISVLQ
jgi:LAO/AO transport system kinase